MSQWWWRCAGCTIVASKVRRRILPPPLPWLAPFIGKAGFMDEGSHGRRMVCKELDVTSTTHELLTHTPPVCDRSSIAPTALGIWKSQGADGLNCIIVEEDFEYGNPTGLAACHSLICYAAHPSLQDLLPQLIHARKTNSGVDSSTLFRCSILTSHSFAAGP